MSQIQVTARLTIHEGKLDAFRAVASRCMDAVRTRDTGTLQYDWFLSPDGTECVVRETYRDSEAVLEHMGNLADLLGQLGALADLDVEVYGVPSPALVEAAAPLAPRVYAPFQSL